MKRSFRRGESYHMRAIMMLVTIFALVTLPLISACNHMIYDGVGDSDCSVNLRFRYDYNMKYADAFANEVTSVTVYLIDEEGNIAWQGTERGDTLASESYEMSIPTDAVEPGIYEVVVWGGDSDKGSFSVAETNRGEELTCSLNRSYNAEGEAYYDEDLDRLFHGELKGIEFAYPAENKTYTVPIVKNTNNVHIVLQQMSGAEMEENVFSFVITSDNGTMAFDNEVIDDEEITYYAWFAGLTSADFDTYTAVTPDATSYVVTSRRSEENYSSRTSFSAVSAEIATARLMSDQRSRLTVTNTETDEIVLSVPLEQMALLLKSEHYATMQDQEFLDREDEYDFVFFLDEGYRWVDTYIYINSWKVVLQSAAL